MRGVRRTGLAEITSDQAPPKEERRCVRTRAATAKDEQRSSLLFFFLRSNLFVRLFSRPIRVYLETMVYTFDDFIYR